MTVLYTVEMALTEIEPDEVWKQWFSDMKPLESFSTVPGFETAQRLKGIGTKPTPSLGYYRIANAGVLDSDAYIANNGRKMNTPSWRPRMSYWHRNLFEGDIGPVDAGSVLFTLDATGPDRKLDGLSFTWFKCIGLDRTVPWRGFAVMSEGEAQSYLGLETEVDDLICYRAETQVHSFL